MLVLGEEARENGLKLSLLERLQVLYQKCGGNALKHMVSLNTNYRCHKDIMRICNELFYQSEVKISHSRHPQIECPLFFVCSSLTSIINLNLEAKLVLEQIKQVVASWPANWGKMDLTKICFTTASQPQVYIYMIIVLVFNNVYSLTGQPSFFIGAEENKNVYRQHSVCTKCYLCASQIEHFVCV